MISEDSDLLAYGCTRVLFKLDNDGTADLVQIERVLDHAGFQGWTFDMFREFCVLCGCDFVQSPAKLGPKTAQKLISKYQTFDNILPHLQQQFTLDPNYERDFKQALLTFQHQRVYDPTERKVSHRECVFEI